GRAGRGQSREEEGAASVGQVKRPLAPSLASFVCLLAHAPAPPASERSGPPVPGGAAAMTYVIVEACIGVKDRAWVDVCPVDCIYEGEDMLYIHPDECIDCGACE